VAHTTGHLLVGLVDEDWGRRYGRPVRLGKNPTRPKTRILAVGQDACRLLEHLRRHGPYPTSSPTAAPLIVARFTKSQCQPCAVHAQWTTSKDGARNVGFPRRELRDLQVRVRAEQQTPDWKARYTWSAPEPRAP
jgi:hypothetical protein